MAKVKDSGLTPTLMSDSQATALGLKVYSAGTPYNGGVVPTILSSAHFTTAPTLRPYQTQDGRWWLKGSVPAGARNTFNATLGTGFNNSVDATAVQSDGKVLVGGNFTTLNGAAGTPDYFARLNPGGAPDTAFNATLGTGFNAPVAAITLQTDGKILVGGNFTTLNGVTRNRLVRLNADGTPDTAFNANLGTGFNGAVAAITLQTDGKVLIGGSFTALNEVAGTPDYLVRLNADGTPDTVFNANISAASPSAAVSVITMQSSGKILVSGLISGKSVIRINSNGTLDTSFNTNIGSGYRLWNYGDDVYYPFNALSICSTSDSKILLTFPTARFYYERDDYHDLAEVYWNGNSTVPHIILNENGTYSGYFFPDGNGYSETDGFSNPGLGPLLKHKASLLPDGRVLLTSSGYGSRHYVRIRNAAYTATVALFTFDFIAPVPDINITALASGDKLFIGLTYRSSPTSGINLGGETITNFGLKTLAGGVQPRNPITDTISGVTFASSGNQPVLTYTGSANPVYASTLPNTGNITITSTADIAALGYSFDVELAAKPTWAY